MFRITVSGIMLTLMLTAMLTLAFNIQPLKAEPSTPTVPDDSAAIQATINAASQEYPQTEWNKTYGGTYTDGVYALVQTTDGGYALAGSTDSTGAGGYDFWLVKTDSSGNMQWNKTYGGTAEDVAYALVQTTDGGYALAGYTESFGAGSYDVWLVKTDANGNAEWNKTYGGAAIDKAWALVQTGDGGYALAGFFGGDVWLVKTDASGNAQWNKTYGGTNWDEANALVQTSDGGYALAGWTGSYGAGYYDVWLVKTDANGDMQWNKTWGGTAYDEANALVQTGDGGYALAGLTGSFGAGGVDFWLVKTDSSGNMQWNKTYGGAADDYAFALVRTGDGGYALAGFTKSFGAGGYDFWLAKTDAVGNMQWNKTYGGAADDYAFALVRTGDGGYALAGYTTSFGAGGADVWLVKLGPEGEFHDVATTNVAPSKTVVGQGFSATLNVTVANQGSYAETFNATAYANTTIIASKNVTLPAGNSTTVTFTWNTTGFAYGNYTISAYASPVPGETNNANNNFTGGWVTVSLVGDITGPNGRLDGKVDMRDIGLVARSFEEAMPPAPAICDLTGPTVGVPDGKIDMRDIGFVARHFGDHYP